LIRSHTKSHRSNRINKYLVLVAAFAALTLLAACGGPPPPSGWSSPLVADSTVYFGGTNGKFYALDANAGTLKWTYTGEQNQPLGAVYGQPAVDNGQVFFGATNGILYDLNTADGKVKWM
jgi:outer membrane protein assembly factor BamB